jgi:hypothetical protein
MQRRRWKDLNPTQRVFVIVGAIVQITLLVLAQRDLAKRPAEQVRGPKAVWRVATMVNFVGPIAYFIWGRAKKA